LVGETTLLAFSYAQTRSRGGFIVATAYWRARRDTGLPQPAARRLPPRPPRGWLPAQDGAARAPLAEVRAELRIERRRATRPCARPARRRWAWGRRHPPEGRPGSRTKGATFDRPGDSAVDSTQLPIVQQQRVKGAKSRCSGETSRGDRPRRPESVLRGSSIDAESPVVVVTVVVEVIRKKSLPGCRANREVEPAGRVHHLPPQPSNEDT
jgi:hypothetical protein